MITEYMPDGTLTIQPTEECAYLVGYYNKLAGGAGTERFEYPDDLTVVIIKGAGEKPETVIAYAYGNVYEVTAPDHLRTDLCVPHWLGM